MCAPVPLLWSDGEYTYIILSFIYSNRLVQSWLWEKWTQLNQEIGSNNKISWHRHGQSIKNTKFHNFRILCHKEINSFLKPWGMEHTKPQLHPKSAAWYMNKLLWISFQLLSKSTQGKTVYFTVSYFSD